jgi:hypothetical protein
MGFKEKMGEGVTAIGEFSFDEIYAITKRIIDAMGEKTATIGSVSKEDETMVLGFMKPAYKKLLGRGLFSGLATMKDVDLTAGLKTEKDGSKSKLTLCIVDATTVQSKVMGFIPASPKSVEGLTEYRQFMDHFVSEMNKLTPPPVIERT